ncbi:MAG: prolipoprotein diacylglyceryl transferase family protein [Bacillota bacterium]
MSKPVIFFLGPLQLNLFGLTIAAGIAVGLLLVRLECRRRRVRHEPVIDALLWSVLVGIAGARVLYVLLNLGHYLRTPLEVFMVWQGGLSFAGAVLGGVGAAYYQYRRLDTDFATLADVAAPALAAGYAVARLGCDIYGKVTTVPWAVPVYGEFRHPVQYYSAIGAGIMFLILWHKRKELARGRLFALYLLLYAGLRFVVEFFRESPMLGFLSAMQVLMLALGALALLALGSTSRSRRRTVR